jgi:hypothetical protein
MTIPVEQESASRHRYDSIEDRSRLLQKQLSKLEGWWSFNGSRRLGRSRARPTEPRASRRVEDAQPQHRRSVLPAQGIAPPRAQYRPEDNANGYVVDASGELVMSFTGKVRNLARLAELTNVVDGRR